MHYTGVHNVDAHTVKAAQQCKQEEAVKCIQAAYRGHQVRKSLHWNLPSVTSHQKPKQTKPTVSYPPTTTTTTTTSKQKVSAVKSKKPAKIMPHKSKSKSAENFQTPLTDELSHNTVQEVDRSSSYPFGSSEVPPWEQTGGDKMSVINIYTRQYEKLQEQYNATTG